MTEFLIREAMLSIFTAWFLAQVVLKILTFSYKKRKLFLNAAFMGGGMPSGHSALVASLSTAIGLAEGFDSPVFVVAIVFSVLVIYETLVTKRVVAGLLKIMAVKHTKKEMLEEMGHSLLEVSAGVAIGILVVLVFYFY